MEERILSLVSLIALQVQTRQELFSEEGAIMDALVSSGHHLQDVDAALTILQSLAQDGDGSGRDDAAALRSMSAEERSRFTVEAFGLLTRLSALGVLSESAREEIIDKALSLYRGRIGLSEIRSLLALALFGDVTEPDDAISPDHDLRRRPWQ